MFCHSDLWFIHKKARRTVKLAGPLIIYLYSKNVYFFKKLQLYYFITLDLLYCKGLVIYSKQSRPSCVILK